MALKTVNEKQLAVLRWIGEGCPVGVWDAGSDVHKVSAAALRSRRLVTIEKIDGTWHARLTAAGEFFLANNEYPSGHWVERPKVQRQSSHVAQPKIVRERVVKALAPMEQLVADVIEAGGQLTVESHGDRDVANLVSSAMRFGAVPAGKLLKVDSGESWREKIVSLVDLPSWVRSDSLPVPVSDRLSSPHRVITGISSDPSQLQMKEALRKRALRILDALAREAERRGHAVHLPKDMSDNRYLRGVIIFTIIDQRMGVTINEPTDRTNHEKTAKEKQQEEKYNYSWAPKYDYSPSGRLRLLIEDGLPIMQNVFVDGKRTRVEDRLDRVMLEMELRAFVALEKKAERERAETLRQERWEKALADARVLAVEDHRAQVLWQQITDWQRAQQIDAYIEAMTARIKELPPAEQDQAIAWRDWALAHRRERDPLTHNLHIPDAPEFSTQDLRAYVGGISGIALS
jgi:hypothetical protein